MKYLFFCMAVCIMACTKTTEKKTNPEYDSLCNKGESYIKRNMEDSAIIYFAQAIQLDSSRVEGYYGKGYCLGNLCVDKDTFCNEAIEYMTKVISIDSTYREAYYNRSVSETKLSDFLAALDDVNIAIMHDSTVYDYYINRSVIRYQLGDTTGAIIDLHVAERIKGIPDITP